MLSNKPQSSIQFRMTNLQQQRAEVERQTQAFLGSVMQSILPVVSVANLRLVTGLLGLLLDRSDIVAVARTRVSTLNCCRNFVLSN
jgi:hypothetical protein